MNRLLIDIGNSRVKWAVAQDEHLLATAQAVPLAESEQLFAAWQALPGSPPAHVRMVSVIDRPVVTDIKQWVKSQWGVVVERVVASDNKRIVVAYEQTEQLGADRWLAMIGAQSRGLLPACIIDCGSAITIDAVDLNGRHYGGLILPGLAAQKAGLMQIASALPVPDFSQPSPLLGRNSVDAVLSGHLHGTAAAIEGLVARIRKETDLPLPAVLTGGDAARLSVYFSETPPVLPELVLEGLAAIG